MRFPGRKLKRLPQRQNPLPVSPQRALLIEGFFEGWWGWSFPSPADAPVAASCPLPRPGNGLFALSADCEAKESRSSFQKEKGANRSEVSSAAVSPRASDPTSPRAPASAHTPFLFNSRDPRLLRLGRAGSRCLGEMTQRNSVGSEPWRLA